jgi:cytochrome c biogenesis protein
MGPRDSIRVTTEEDLTPPAAPRQRGRGGAARALAVGRNLWRQLTSMRTALILLFLLALASLPGALLPQWTLNSGKTAQYILDHPTIGPILDRLGFLHVFASPWYAAIYLLLFVSLIGCLLPRSVEFIGQWRAKPVATPRNLARLPHHAAVTVDEDVDTAARRIRTALRHKGFGGWRVVEREEPGGVRAISAERGYLREVGNLVFHFALLGLLISVALGSLFGYAASVIITQGAGFCSTPAQYDNFRPGTLVDGTDMTPFCVTVQKFQASYTDSGQATSFSAQLQVQSGADLATGTWRQHTVEVNDPLRIAGQRLYLLGHGYSPTFEITYPDGETRSYTAPFQPEDSMFTSQGVVKVTDPPGVTGDAVRQHQLALVGIFAPSGVVNGGVLTSAYPDALRPMVAIEVYRGDLGMEGGRPQSVFAIDNNQVALKLLVSQGRANLAVGQSMTLDDGTKITFTGAQPWVSLQTSYDPAQGWALVSAIFLVAGLLVSLTVRRRRVWYRIRPADAMPGSAGPVARRTLIDVGGLARTDQAGYGGEFSSLVELAAPERRPPAPDDSTAPGAASRKG